MPRTLCAGSTDRCGRFSAFWWSLPGSGPQRQAPVGPARICERDARSRPVLLLLSAKRDSRRFLAILVGVWGVWDARMAPKINRTPRSLRARQNQDPGGTRKDKKLPVPGSKEHSNLQVKGGLHKTTDMEKDARYSVPTMFSSVMRPKQRSTEKVACDAQPNMLGVNDEHVPVAFTSPEVFTPMFDAGGREPPYLDEEIPLTDSDIESSSAASIWVSNYLTCRRKSAEQTEARSSSGAKLRREPIKPQEEDGEMQWDYTATQQAFSKRDSACSTLVPPPTGDLAEPPSLDLIYRTLVQNHEQTQRESRKMKAASRQLQLSIKKVVKSCQDIGARIATMETRTEELEIEVKAATAQTTTQGQQISDIQWKLEDAENRQRGNNLRILGIAEDLEGQDTRAYIVSLFKQAFPDLNDCELGQNGGNYVSTMRLPESRSLSYVLSVCKTGKFDYWDIRYIEENLETVYLSDTSNGFTGS
ncbi:hypothetical protein NDU88_003470 [Pleurodeles waltl]|uniref:Uncharacterized protein n=1 Tax=Pleurodeles waltl TaxID=8319 RepID=A0AAV7QCR7_PLEWA|nr:hypothetical protein NDU88_003470 [Pleurodeles waltl]